jgi:hypothetical protein
MFASVSMDLGRCSVPCTEEVGLAIFKFSLRLNHTTDATYGSNLKMPRKIKDLDGAF